MASSDLASARAAEELTIEGGTVRDGAEAGLGHGAGQVKALHGDESQFGVSLAQRRLQRDCTSTAGAQRRAGRRAGQALPGVMMAHL